MRQHLLGLDGLRGIVAMLVVFHHIAQQIPGSQAFYLYYLGVDFFFLLSGFVIASAYEARLRKTMSVGDFAVARFKRLYPMVALGALVGVLPYAIGANPIEGRIGYAFAMQATLIPQGWQPDELFQLNPVMWSLFFEVVANAFHATFLRWLSLRTLCILVAVSALSLLAVAVRYHGLSVGWRADLFVAGFVRVTFSYSLGVLLYRLHQAGRLPKIRAPWPIIVAAIILVPLAFSVTKMRTLPAPLIVMGLFPALMCCAINTPLPHIFKMFATVSGALSYPLYALHLPLLWTAGAVIALSAKPGGALAWTLWIASTAAICGISWVALKLYDEPARRIFSLVPTGQRPEPSCAARDTVTEERGDAE